MGSAAQNDKRSENFGPGLFLTLHANVLRILARDYRYSLSESQQQMLENRPLEPVIIYSAERSYEADIIRGILEMSGIISLHVPDYSAGLFGVLVNLNIGVAKKDVEDAIDIFRGFEIEVGDPLKTYLSADILRTISNFLPPGNRWVKLYAKLYLLLWLIALPLMLFQKHLLLLR